MVSVVKSELSTTKYKDKDVMCRNSTASSHVVILHVVTANQGIDCNVTTITELAFSQLRTAKHNIYNCKLAVNFKIQIEQGFKI